ncbi:hypothetical protein [uncultured Methylobacterium sp.]|uniref:hypothetical protein n=1 Tax=uncultured Methylobacterium sp. TaxID=157278 RepID=UPI0035CAAAAB
MSGEAAIELTMQAVAIPVSGRLLLPLRVQVQGIEAVLVSADAYDALFQAARKSVGTRSRIERDPEVQRFVDERLSTHELTVLRDEIAKQFGSERTPSSSGLNRYAVARRRLAEAVTMRAKGRRNSRGPR